VVLICISFMARDGEHFFLFLTGIAFFISPFLSFLAFHYLLMDAF
jgi:hypothetical protein